jgi:nucleotide-binding universal stress UspA family protein
MEDKVKICKDQGKIDQITYQIEVGKPVDEIVRIAEKNNFDLIVMVAAEFLLQLDYSGVPLREY